MVTESPESLPVGWARNFEQPTLHKVDSIYGKWAMIMYSQCMACAMYGVGLLPLNTMAVHTLY